MSLDQVLSPSSLTGGERLLYRVGCRLPVISRIIRKWEDVLRRAAQAERKRLADWEAELGVRESLLRQSLYGAAETGPGQWVDWRPWDHPHLTEGNIGRFRGYSEAVWAAAREHSEKQGRPLRLAFSVNMAQNMYKWATLARSRCAEADLFLHPLDRTALNRPEWEEFDGEFGEVMDGDAFIQRHPGLHTRVPYHEIPMDDRGLLNHIINSRLDLGKVGLLLGLLGATPTVRYEPLLSYAGFYLYYRWAQALSRYDAIHTTSAPAAAYFSGRPYTFCSVGGDLQMDACRRDDHGALMRVAVASARFIFLSNPHTLGYCRRLGVANAVYLPYPFDSTRYCPGEPVARREWQAKWGPGFYVLSTARLDTEAKGQGAELLDALFRLAQGRPSLRFVVLRWGLHAKEFEAKVRESGLARQFIILSPVGKKRLIDYYRSCDAVLDHFVYGYYGATALEAASIGRPVIMRLRDEHYRPLYAGDVAPVENASTPEEVTRALVRLMDQEEYRQEKGEAIRQWLQRNHGEERTVPIMLDLLRMTADQVPVPPELKSPLLDPETDAERAYHAALAQGKRDDPR